jgi:autotransporter-associated beta strand protein
MDATGSYTITLSGTQTVGGITFEDGIATISGGTALTLNGSATITVNTSVKGIIDSQISGSAGLVKAGAGELVLSGGNSFSGGLTLQRGTLTLDNDGAADSGSITNSNGSGAAVLHSSKLLTTLANNIALGAANGNSLEINADSGNQLVLNGVISGSHTWSANGAGTVVLGGASANTFISAVTVAQGTLLLTKDVALGTSGTSGNGTVVNSGATLAIQASMAAG